MFELLVVSTFVVYYVLANPELIGENIVSFPSTRNEQSGTITFPLIPHHVQRKRHLDLALHLEKNHREAGYPARRRPRGRLTMQEGINETEFSSPQHVATLYQGYGTHYVDLWCGTPPQRQTVIVDTGSSMIGFTCSDCLDCGVPTYHVDPAYQEDESASFRRETCQECSLGYCSSESNDCHVEQSYMEGSSWAAFEAEDICYVGGLHNEAVENPVENYTDPWNPFNAKSFSFRLKFGCKTSLTGLFVTQLESGIMGMDASPASYWWQMYDAKRIAHKSFSLCFIRRDYIDTNGTEAGAMTLGGTDTRLHKSDMVFSATKTNTESFGVYVKRVWLREPGGGDSALASMPNMNHKLVEISESEINIGTIIVDSGTTDTYFSSSFGTAFKAAWKEMVGTDYSNDPLSTTLEELGKTKPTILIQLQGVIELNSAIKERSGNHSIAGLADELDIDNPYDVILAIPPSHYYELDVTTGMYVARFYVDDWSAGVIGANAMIGHDVYFDVQGGKIGWAESNCDSSSMVSKYVNVSKSPNPASSSGIPGMSSPGYSETANQDITLPSTQGTASHGIHSNDLGSSRILFYQMLISLPFFVNLFDSL